MSRPATRCELRPSSPLRARSVGVGPRLEVDLGAVAANTEVFAARIPGALMAVVKADGFGHGAADVARTALVSGASWLGVTTLGEAVDLRQHGIEAPVLSWLNPVDAEFVAAAEHRIDVAVPGEAHLRAVAAAAIDVGRVVDVHLHVDVGMARDGAEPTRWPALCRLARSLERQGLIRVVGVMAHLGWADDPGDVCNAVARCGFDEAVDVARAHHLRPRVRHLAATAAVLTDPSTHLDLCRVGAGLVGIDPSRTTRLRPAMSFTAPVVGVRDVPRGTPVGYGHAYATPAATRLALLPVGYADGVPRAATGQAWVQLRGRRVPIVGLVSMDQVVVDVGAEAVAPGEVATIFGPGTHGEPTVADWAAWAGTIEHEIVTGIGARVTRSTTGGVR